MRNFVPIPVREQADPLWKRLTAYFILCFFGAGGMAGVGFAVYVFLYSHRWIGGYIRELPIARQDFLFLAFVIIGAVIGLLAAFGYSLYAEREDWRRRRARRNGV